MTFRYYGSWGAENITRGEAETLSQAIEKAKAWNGSGARAKVWGADGAIVFDQRVALRYRDAKLVWEDAR